MKYMRHALLGVAVIGICTGMVQSGPAAWADSQKRPILHEFIEQVSADHPALKAAEAALAAARARAKGQSRPIYNPEIEVGYEDGAEVTKEIGLSQTFDWSGKRKARTLVGRAGIDAAEASYAIAKKALLSDILEALSEYQTASSLLDVAERREDLSRQFLDLAARRHKAGEMPQAELLTARLALAEARAAKNEAMLVLSSAEERLAAISGQDRDVWPRLTGAPLHTVIVPETTDYERLPELRLAQAQSEIARARIRVAKSERMPDPTVGVRVGEEGSSSLVGLSASIPIPIRNSYRDQVDAAGSDFLEVQQNYYAENRRVRARYDASLKRYLAASQAWSLWQDQGAEPLKEQRLLLGKLLDARQIGAIDYLIQLNQTFATEEASVELNGRLWNAWFDWQDAGATVEEWLETIQ
ncbi:TolC family protein [Kordiimonas lacus]|uniref:Outer membrane protein, cobalt-zinc-cadmium efflux system n=1 Tax=Kordiimonas lacus TaxID=637679 RepID=A0A1G6WJG0_9PROT|nr:TolC family protein [Kordiimonas lacus]SDD65823.1 outer membrane protein, cobalt-zinc-cadmium efflux system [Kordiimonas lacus]